MPGNLTIAVMEPWQVAVEYHQQTKHHFHRFARSLGYLDWANQPNPFRRFAGAPLIPLLMEPRDSGAAYDDIFRPSAVASAPVDLHSISAFFQYSMGISAWKEYRGTRWALRVNPSSGNLHPTECYLIAGPVAGMSDAAGVYHYAPKDHLLEQRAIISDESWREMVGELPVGAFFVGLTSILWREVWKYGERGFRYCQHDVGHAFAAIALSAAHLGWQVRWLRALEDNDVSRLLGLDRADDFEGAEIEHPDLLAVMVPDGCYKSDSKFMPPGHVIENFAAGQWFGKANQLSREHVEWEWVKRISESSVKPRSGDAVESASRLFDSQELLPELRGPEVVTIPARKIFLQRRSGVAFDGSTSITDHQFFRMLGAVIPRACVPWNAMQETNINLLLFVHRVDGVRPGLYFLFRDPTDNAAHRFIRQRMREDFLWERMENVPEKIPLFALQYGDGRKLAAQVSCGQEIAADGCFAVSMIAEFERPLREYGAWFYRRLHWEAGMVGQMLYLEAEAAGVRATGIGCYFDDPVHDLLGLQGMAYQSLYHFTVGGAVGDERLVRE